VDRPGLGARRHIRKRIVEHDRRGLDCGRHDEGLNIEAADEPAMADAIFVGLDIALVPG
jgi:hypothetical protein